MVRRRTGLVVGLALGVIAACVQRAPAQLISVYGTFSPTHASGVQTGVVSNTNQTTSFWAPAFGGGVTLNFVNLHVAKLGFDFRGSTKPGTTGADTAEGGLLLAFNPPVIRLKPYAQVGVGYLATRTVNVTTGSNGATFSNQYATVGFHAGVDRPLYPFVDWRVVEVGYAHAFNTGIKLGGSTNNANLFSLATGLVVHF